MRHLAAGTRVVLASGNAGKLRELHTLLQPLGLDVLSQREFDVTQADESGLTFVENALIKARHAAAATGLPAIADDSGLEVDALAGAPGVHSARYAGSSATDADNVRKLLDALADVPDARRTARFRALVVALARADDPAPLICEGVWEGVIARAPAGEGGFGYDPVFIVPALGVTSAQLQPGEKNRLSHRGSALRQLAARLAG